MTQQRYLLVEGHVQGVSFRACTQEKANELNLQGYARNLPDGRVEIVAEGSEDELEQFEDWCWQGSPAAEVATVRSESRPATGGFSGFEVR